MNKDWQPSEEWIEKLAGLIDEEKVDFKELLRRVLEQHLASI